MFLDNSLAFSTFASPQAVSLNNSTVTSTNVIDLTGAGSGNAPAMIGGFPQVNNALGFDLGTGDGEAIPQLVLIITAAGTGAGVATISLQAAPDNGSFSPGTYVSAYVSPGFVGTSLVAGSILVVPVPPVPPDESFGLAPPRFYRLSYNSPGIATFSVAAYIAINASLALQLQKYASNYLAA